jgi:hypothetical protein
MKMGGMDGTVPQELFMEILPLEWNFSRELIAVLANFFL